MSLVTKINPGVIWLLIAIATDVLSTFYSAKGNGLVNKLDQGIALVLYMISFACAVYALKFMQAGILYVLWSGIGVIATALLAKAFLGQNIDLASDTNDQFCAQSNTVFTVGNNHYISINLDAHEQADAKRLFDALSANGKIEMPLEKTFWGALYGAFTDQFGVKWMVNCQLEEG